MRKLKKAYKIELNPSEEQKIKIHQTIGVARFVYNFYIAYNKEVYEKEGRFLSGMDFSKWLNNEYIPNNPSMKWMKDVSSKATKQAIMNADKAFRDFFKGRKDSLISRKRRIKMSRHIFQRTTKRIGLYKDIE